MVNHTQNNLVKQYIDGLIELNQADEKQVLEIFKVTPSRKNPTIGKTGNYNQLFRYYLKSESSLLSNLVDIMQLANKEQLTLLSKIIARRLEALSTLVNFQTNSFFL